MTERLRKSIDDLMFFPNVWQMRAGPLWYAARNGIVCRPGTWYKGADGLQHICQ